MAYNIPTHTHNEHLALYLKEALALNENEAVEKILAKCLSMVEGLEDYLENISPPESSLQQKLYVDTMKEPWDEHYENGLTLCRIVLQAVSSRHSTQFLKMVVEMNKSERILEIGMLTGYTASIFCEAACSKEVTSLEIDPFLEKFVKSRITGTIAEQKLKILVGPALNSLEVLKKEGRKFDLVFIDADKNNYINYYNFIMDNGLVVPNGVFLLDNTLWKGEMYPEPTTEFAKSFTTLNEFIRNDNRVTQVIVQVCDGISMIRVNP